MEWRSDDFIKSVAWSKEPAIRAALVGVFKRAEDVDSLLAALPAVEEKELIHDHRLEPLLAALPADEGGPYGQGFHLLIALGQRTPEKAKPAFDRYLKGGTPSGAIRCAWSCER